MILLGQTLFTNDFTSLIPGASPNTVPARGDTMLLLTALSAVSLLLVLLVVLFRKNKKRHDELQRSPWSEAPAYNYNHAKKVPVKEKIRRRIRRREHRPRNPTLAETGGLPPRREENPPIT